MTFPSTQGSKTEHHEEKWQKGNNLEVTLRQAPKQFHFVVG